MLTVKPERSGWRDLSLSARHREWGWDCPAVDLDFVMCEFNKGVPIAIIEYKKFDAKMPDFDSKPFQAISYLADAVHIPFLVAYYWPDIWAFRLYAVNARANAMRSSYFDQPLTERKFVDLLYRLRNAVITPETSSHLNNELPEDFGQHAARRVS